VLVGWGVDEESQKKYWIVRNSYSKKWGAHGDFLMERGNNDFGIEADLIAFDVALCSDTSSSSCIPI